MPNNILENNRISSIFYYCFLSFIIFFSFYYGLALYPLADNNEGLYAEVAREMLESGNFVIPHLNYLPYIEKPPLLYWLIAVGYKLFGVSAFSARIITTTAGASICLALLWFGKKIDYFKESKIAALMLASSLGFIIIARIVFFDMLLTAFLTFSLLLFYVWYQNHKVSYLRIAYLFLALAVLTKGLLSLVIVGLSAIIFLLATHQKNRIKNLFDPIGILIFLAIALPWHIIAEIQFQGFSWDYFINEQFLRFFHKRIPHDYYSGPFYYYLPRILIYISPWYLFFPLFFKKSDPSKKQLNLFLSICCLVPLLFFSISKAKANYYVIVIAPFLILLLAQKINEVILAKKHYVFVSIYLFLILIFTAALTIGLHFPKVSQITNALPVIKTSLLILLVFSLIGLGISFVRKYICLSFASVVLLGTLTTVIMVSAANFFKNEYSQIELANYINEHPPKHPIFLHQDFEGISTILFYTQQRIALIDSRSKDLFYGKHSDEAEGWFFTVHQFSKFAQKNNVYVVIDKNNFHQFREKISNKIRLCLVASSSNVLLLTNNNCYSNQKTFISRLE